MASRPAAWCMMHCINPSFSHFNIYNIYIALLLLGVLRHTLHAGLNSFTEAQISRTYGSKCIDIIVLFLLFHFLFSVERLS